MLSTRLVSGTAWTFGVFAAFFALWSRWLAWKASQQLYAEKQQRREWHTIKWRRVRDSPWLELPEAVIAWLVGARNSLNNADWHSMMIAALTLYPIAMLWMPEGWGSSRQAVKAKISENVLLGFVLAGLLFGGAMMVKTFRHRATDERPDLWRLLMRFTLHNAPPEDALVGLLFAPVIYLWLGELTRSSIGRAVVGALLLLPCLAFVLAQVHYLLLGIVAIFQKRKVNGSPLFGFSLACSFSISLLAMLIGHQIDQQALLPQTRQMLWSNAFFDGATVVTTLFVLERAIPPHKLFAIPIAVLVNLMMGILFACGSLWIGVKGITLIQVARVLIAHSLDGLHWEFGPYFWTMHTTFLPLLLYLLLILLCWAAKVFLSQRERFHQRAKELDGLAMTASFLGLVSASLAVAALLLKLLV